MSRVLKSTLTNKKISHTCLNYSISNLLKKKKTKGKRKKCLLIEFQLSQPSLFSSSPIPLFLVIIGPVELMLHFFSNYFPSLACSLLPFYRFAILILVRLIKLIFYLLFLIRIGFDPRKQAHVSKITPKFIFIVWPIWKYNQPSRINLYGQIYSSTSIYV